MTEHEAQVTALVAEISTVTDVGIVHDRPRYGDAHDHWVTQIDGVDMIRAWEVGLSPEGVRVQRTTQNHRHRWRSFNIVGYVGLDDEGGGYTAIAALAEQIADAVDADVTHGGTFLHSDPVQTGEISPVFIGGGFLCWSVTLSLVGYTVVSP